MICPNCGKTIPDDARFCSGCGYKLSSGLDLPLVDVANPEPAPEGPMVFDNDSPVNVESPAEAAAKPTNICSVCGKDPAARNLLDGYVCQSCMSKTFNHSVRWSKMTVAMVQESIEMQKIMDQRRANFSKTDGVGSKFEIDRTHQLACVNGKVYLGWDEIVDFSTVDNGKEISRGGWGGMLVGKAIGGNTGAIIGHSAKSKSVRTVTQLYVKIVTSNPAYPQIQINMVGIGKVKTDTHQYKRISANTEKILSLLTIVTNESKNAKAAAPTPVQVVNAQAAPSAADEIMKYKILLDQGAITQEEFEAKKKELL